MEQIKAVFNGKFDSLKNIQISPFSRAYTFSDSVYEVVPFYNSKPIAYDNHIKRLQSSSNALSMKINLNVISNEIEKLISLCESKSGYVYYQVTRGQDLIRSHMHSNDIELETFGYVLPHFFETKFLKDNATEFISLFAITKIIGAVKSKYSINEFARKGQTSSKNTEAGANNVIRRAGKLMARHSKIRILLRKFSFPDRNSDNRKADIFPIAQRFRCLKKSFTDLA